MANGIVKWFDPRRGFGFVVNEHGEDIFVHYTNVIVGEGEFRCLQKGQVVEYQQLNSPNGLHGKEVRVIESIKHTTAQNPVPQKDSSLPSQ